MRTRQGCSAGSDLETLRRRFLDLRFGMFIHFNMSTFHEVEWAEPGQDPSTFNPTRLDIAQWARGAASAGMKYAVLTTKHHDGFCLWPSAYARYGIQQSPLAGRDLVAEYVQAFRAQGIEPHLYFSVWDRHHGIPGPLPHVRAKAPIPAAGLALMKDQLSELLTHYGPIGSLTFDGWGNCGTLWRKYDYDQVYAHVKRLQPQCLVTDHWQVPRATGHATVPDDERISFAQAYAINDILHFEEPDGPWGWVPQGNAYASHQGPTLQSAWFWKQSFPDEALMSVEDIVDRRLRVLEDRCCNLLLNVAPNPDGLLDDNVMRRLAEVGQRWQRGEAG